MLVRLLCEVSTYPGTSEMTRRQRDDLSSMISGLCRVKRIREFTISTVFRGIRASPAERTGHSPELDIVPDEVPADRFLGQRRLSDGRPRRTSDHGRLNRESRHGPLAPIQKPAGRL